MIKNSFAELVLIRVTIFALQAIAPLCLLYCAVRIAGFSLLPLPLEILAFVEALFFICVFLPLRHAYDTSEPVATKRSRAERQALFDKFWENVPDLPLFISTWFKGAPVEEVRRDDFKDFLAWALLYKASAEAEDDEELEEYVLQTESRLGMDFKPGFGSYKAARSSIDPLRIRYKSLFFYLVSSPTSE